MSTANTRFGTLALVAALAWPALASAADGDEDGCQDSYFDANGACLGTGVTVGEGTVIGSNVSIGADTALGAEVFVGARATLVGRSEVEAARPVGARTVIGRSAYIDADHHIGIDNIFGRSATSGRRLQTASAVTVGYAAMFGDDVTIQSNAHLGALVDVGNNTTILASAVLARGVTVFDSDTAASIGGIIGPNVTIGGGSTIASTARIRKDAVLEDGATILGGARIGRGATIEEGATVGENAKVGANATVPAGAVVPDGFVLRRGLTFHGTGGVEVCDSGLDDDGDSLVDCLDPQCATEAVCLAPPQLDPLFVFAASSGDSGDELWVSDGTAAGTAMLPQINPDTTGFDTAGCLAAGNDESQCFLLASDCEAQLENEFCIVDGGSSPGHFMPMGAHLYFTADDGTHGREVWRTNGTTVERITDINTAGDSFDTPSYGAPDDPSQVFGVQGDYLYFIASPGDGSRSLYRYSDAGGVEVVPMATSGVDYAQGPIAVYDDVVYTIVDLPTGNNRDLVAFDGVNPAALVGVPPIVARFGNHLSGLVAVDNGVLFRGYDGDYRTFGYAPNEEEPLVFVYNYDGNRSQLGDTTVVNGRLCGLKSWNHSLVCFDGNPGIAGAVELGPSMAHSGGEITAVDGDYFCFNVSFVGLFCTDGTSAATQLVGTPIGSKLTSYEGNLYFNLKFGHPHRYDFDGSAATQIFSTPNVGGAGKPVGLPGQDTVAYPANLLSSAELRFYHPSDGTVDVAVIDPLEGYSVPKRLTAWVR